MHCQKATKHSNNKVEMNILEEKIAILAAHLVWTIDPVGALVMYLISRDLDFSI